MEGPQVRGILLDTGCSRTLVQQDLVPHREKMDGRVSIRCAHGNVVSYALASISMKIGGQDIQVRAGISPNLPVPVLLGTDGPELVTLLQSQNDGGVTQPVMMVTKRDEAA